jgi:FKBP-type peptidyl-prolyl cis-trans isomerase
MSPFPKWLSWLFVGFLAYIVYIGNQTQTPPASAPKETPPQAKAQEAPREEYDDLRQLVDKNRWMRAIDPGYIGDANIREVKLGDGDLTAQCGSKVTVLLRGTTRDGASFDAAHDESKPLSFTLGAAPIPALNEGMIGMKAGGVRQIFAPASQVYKTSRNNADEEIMFRLELVAVTAPAEDAFPALAVTRAAGSDEGEPARCGWPIAAMVSVFDAAGKRIYRSDAPLRFIPGNTEIAAGVDLLARGMRVGESRILYLPPAWLTQGEAGARMETLTALRAVLAEKRWVALLLERQE